MKVLKSLLLVLSTGYIFVYFSEHLFWARLRPDDSLQGWLGTWTAYSLMAFLFLVLVSHFRVRTIWALFLVGSAFGWICEGLVVQTAYEMLPLSISFTGLAWHALLTVWVGWYTLRRSLLSADPWSTLKLGALIGLVYGLWAISWWLEPDGGVASIPEFAAFSFITTVLLILAFWLANWSASGPFVPKRWAVILLSALFVLYFCFVAVPAAPWAVLILPALLGLVYWGLRKNRLRETEGSLLASLSGHVPIWKYLSLLVIPAVSVLVYSLAMTLDLQWHTNWILYLITTPAGFILFGVSLVKVLRRKPGRLIPPGSLRHEEIIPDQDRRADLQPRGH